MKIDKQHIKRKDQLIKQLQDSNNITVEEVSK